jgi:PAS domain S-box
MKPVVKPNKKISWIRTQGKVFYDAEKKPFKIIGTLREITEEKQHQQELEESEQKFRLLANSMPQIIWTGDADGNLNYFNQAVYDYSGLTPGQLMTDGWIDIVHPDDREKNIKAWANSIATGKDFLFEHRFRRHDGEYRWQLSRAIPQRDASGSIQMWVGTSTDIQEMKEMDQQKDYFISLASHELKTPITSIKAYTQILQAKYADTGDPFLIKSLNIVDKQILKLTNLISDLLDLSKIKSGTLSLHKEKFFINELIGEVIDEIKHINPGYEITFLQQQDVVLDADRERIGQVLINLMTNAIKYSPESTKIKIESSVKDDLLFVAVEDYGIGINKNEQEKIFERFYRVEGKNEKTFPGFGIGLFISMEIIHRHNGNIGVRSDPGKGSVFSFSIPVSQ